jgi:hypothetical protein
MAAGEMVVFDQSAGSICFKALENSEFVIGSAVQHQYDLVLGRYSVHTSPQALQQGEATIKQMGVALAAQRRLQNKEINHDKTKKLGFAVGNFYSAVVLLQLVAVAK